MSTGRRARLTDACTAGRPNDAAPVQAARHGQAMTLASSGWAISRALAARGVPSAPLLRAAGLPAALSNHPACRVGIDALSRLYALCVQETGDPYFGLGVASHLRLAHLHAFGNALAASTDLMEFCCRLQHGMALILQGARLDLERAGGRVALRFSTHAAHAAEAEDAFVGFLVLSMRALSRPDFHPVRVQLRRAMPPAGDRPYADLMRSAVEFSQAQTILLLDEADLMEPLDGASPGLARLHDDIAACELRRLGRDDLVDAVRHHIAELLPGGRCSRERVARALGLGVSGMQARLSGCGTTFQQVWDDTRRELACRHVLQGILPLSDIAALLGFSNAANFNRAFKRWAGCAPSAFRRG